MQRDLKIGISLCVLMFGVVGAFMFRREQPGSKAQGLQLKTARQLDQKIAQRARTPYMTGDIEHDEDQSASAQDPQDGTRPAHLQPPLHLTEQDDGILAPSHGLGQRTNRRGAGPDAIPPLPRGADGHPRIVTENVTAGPQTHTIQSGDTLSSISEKYFGTQKRFQEIFDVNRGVLANANRLPEGVVITIPVATKPPVKEVRRISDQATVGNRQPHETRRPNSDLTQFSPIAPANGAAGSGPNQALPDFAAIQEMPALGNGDKPESEDQATGSKSAEVKHADTKASETNKKRFFAPSRLPFGNNGTPRGNSQRKPVDPQIEATPESKELRSVDPAHDATRQAYQVRKGDSLERISQRVYGNPRRASDIFNANRDKLASPDAVKEGLELDLPQ
jgi:nucleoid-associated protein YgaU